ncbi:DUF2531 family protein [Raoultella ornithinolytica]|nr:DUF2531 family protein [Raoultella ornithinolytica]ELN4411985.1 DUF2531 family protein [Raoultella ornithinolytica]
MWGKGWRFLWLLPLPLPLPLSLLAGDRDPFRPPEDRCQTAQLAQWRYGGAVGHRHYWVGYLLDHRNQWRRVRKEDALPGGWRIHLLTAERVAITTGPGCEPAHWEWLREKGTKYDAMDKPAVSAVASNSDGKK